MEEVNVEVKMLPQKLSFLQLCQTFTLERVHPTNCVQLRLATLCKILFIISRGLQETQYHLHDFLVVCVAVVTGTCEIIIFMSLKCNTFLLFERRIKHEADKNRLIQLLLALCLCGPCVTIHSCCLSSGL